jgi:CHASE2 domain-containing sensor protein
MAMMISAIRDGKPSLFTTIHVLDLAFVFPTLIVAAVGLWQRRPWSYVLAGPMLILTATMMGSLVVSEGIAAAHFTPDPLPLAVAFSLIALAASLLARHYLRLLPA